MYLKCRGLRVVALLILLGGALCTMPSCETAHLYMDPATGQRSGRLVHNRKCIACHDLFAPSSYTNAEWRRILPEMAREAGLSRSDERLVLDFLLTNN